MRSFIRRIKFLIFCVALFSLQLLWAQNTSIIQDPGRNPFYNYTVVGFYTASPPVIDAIIDDYCWVRPIAASTATAAGAGFNGTDFPPNQNISMQNNVADGGTVDPSFPPPNPYTASGGVYPESAGSFGICWDLDYLYFAVKIVNQAAADLPDATNDRGVEIFFNNGNGRSGVDDPINENYPIKYNNLRDMQLQFWYLPKPGDTDFPLLGALPGLTNRGITLTPGSYKFAVKKTADGYIYEGKIAWTTLNKEFINEADGSYIDDKWRPLKGRLLGLDIGASLLRSGPAQMQMYWNECCFNVNWTRSAYLGYLQLAGDAVCPSFNVTTTSYNITSPNQTITAGGTAFYPLGVDEGLNWQLLANSANGDPLALINNQTGKITPLNNGVLTIVGKSSMEQCANGSSKIAIVTITSQDMPTAISIVGDDIIENGGFTTLTGIISPVSAPSNIFWRIEPTSNLATINSVTGVLRATSLGNGTITIVGAPAAFYSLSYRKAINISGQNPVVLSLLSLSFDSLGGIKTLNITSSAQWLVTNVASWLVISPTSGTGNAQLTITGLPVSNADARNASISFTGTGFVKSLLISQGGLTPKISVSTNEIKFDFSAGELSNSKQFEIATNGSWSIQANVPWVTVSPSSGFGNATITVTVNNSTARYEGIQDFDRTGILTITVGTAIKTVSVVQKGMAPLAILSEIHSEKLIIYPNPSNGSFSVDNGGEVISFQLINSIGTIVAEAKLNKGITKFDFEFAKGIYLFKAGKNSQKLIVE